MEFNRKEFPGGFAMKNKILRVFFTVLLAGAFLAAGCSQKTTGTAQAVDRTNWEWVPRVWIEDNSFGSSGMHHSCSYDIKTEGYWCPPGTK